MMHLDKEKSLTTDLHCKESLANQKKKPTQKNPAKQLQLV